MPVPGTPVLSYIRNNGNTTITVDVTRDTEAITYKVFSDNTASATTDKGTGKTMPYTFASAEVDGPVYVRVKATNASGDSAAYSNELNTLKTTTEGRSKSPVQKVEVI